MVKIFNDFSISTDISKEDKFMTELAFAMKRWIQLLEEPFDDPLDLESIMKNGFEILCSMRGYKTKASVKQIILAGSNGVDLSTKGAPVASFDWERDIKDFEDSTK
jgi:hypothetical protein